MQIVHKIKTCLSSLWVWYGSSSADELMEINHTEYGVKDPTPTWYIYFNRYKDIAIWITAVCLSYVVYLKYQASEGVASLVWFLNIVLGPFILLARVAAIVHKKRRFANSLPPEKKVIYLQLVKNRQKRFWKVLILCTLAMFILIAIVLYIDKATNGNGLF